MIKSSYFDNHSEQSRVQAYLFSIVSFGYDILIIFSCGHATLQEALSVGPLVRLLEVVIELKSVETSVLDTFCVCLSVGGGLGCGWGLDAPAHPSATIL